MPFFRYLTLMSMLETLQLDNIAVAMASGNTPVLTTHYDSLPTLRHAVNEALSRVQQSKSLVDDAICLFNCVFSASL